MIIFRNVSKIYFPERTVALANVSFEVLAGEFISIVGKSGTGKTTLVKILTAEERASEGQVVVGGWDITHIRSREVPYLRRQIGVVFQDYKLLQKKTVFENVAFAMQVIGARPSRIRKIVPEVLKIVGLADKHDRFPRHLSGGEQQRVAIARALAHGPKILVADEPTGNLDTATSQEIIELLLKINQIGTTVLFVSHDEGRVNQIRRRVLVLDQGTLTSDEAVGRYRLS
ncbi:MAG: cell division transport system ATP-binding protein [Parcubacteria group bacterium Gr01-1014_31]|nr:MAG: cell division transport system ATP-binding protein [Parcubacteria group bacterium Gr01-1014_31]